jgi:hypothetical protein
VADVGSPDNPHGGPAPASVDATSAPRSPRPRGTGHEPDPFEVDPKQSRPRQPSTAPDPEVVDLVFELGRLARHLVEHNRRVMATEPHDWSLLVDALDEVANECRALVPTVDGCEVDVTEPHDPEPPVPPAAQPPDDHAWQLRDLTPAIRAAVELVAENENITHFEALDRLVGYGAVVYDTYNSGHRMLFDYGRRGWFRRRTVEAMVLE